MKPILPPCRRAEIIAAADASEHGRWGEQWFQYAWIALTTDEQDQLWQLFRQAPGSFKQVFREQLENANDS